MKKIIVGAPFESCLLNNTTNPAQFYQNWARLAVVFSRLLPNGSLHYLIKKPQTIIALTFVTHNISDFGGVSRNLLENKSE